MTVPARVVRAPRGTSLHCLAWPQEAAFRMIQNNLDPDVAERPEDLIVYGGTGRAARSWAAFDRILQTLARLKNDETLLVQSGKPVGVFRTHEWAPRVLIANALIVPRWATWDEFRRLEDAGLTMYGQMTAGSWIYIGTQGILQGTYETFAAVARTHFDGSLAGRLVVTAGLGGMGGAQPMAVAMNEGVALVVEVDPARAERRKAQGFLDEIAPSLDEALARIERYRRERAARRGDRRAGQARRRRVRLRQQPAWRSAGRGLRGGLQLSRIHTGVHPTAVLGGTRAIPMGRPLRRSRRHPPDRRPRARPFPRGPHARAVATTCARSRALPGTPGAGLLARVRRTRHVRRADRRPRRKRRAQSTDRDRPRPPRLGVGRVALPRNRGHARRQRRHRRLADPERARERVLRRNVGLRPSRRRCGHRQLDTCRHGRRRGWDAARAREAAAPADDGSWDRRDAARRRGVSGRDRIRATERDRPPEHLASRRCRPSALSSRRSS